MSKSIELGVLWKKKDKNGKTYLTGSINVFPHGQVNVAIFDNSYKTKDSQPDMKILYTPVGPEEKSSDYKEDDNTAF